MPIRGLDVSSIQGNIDWAAVKASGIRFVMCKCGNGNDPPDPSFGGHVAGARAAGLIVGAYHVGFPLPLDPAHPGRAAADQARAHFDASHGLGSRAGDLPPGLDLEWPVPGSPQWDQYKCSALQVRTWALSYLQTMEQLWGRTPFLYDGFPDYWAGIGGASEPGFKRYPLWVVNYPEQYKGATPPDGVSPPIPGPWTTWTLWQHSGGGLRLPNGAPVDSNVFNGDDAAFAALLAPAAPIAAV